MKRLTFDGLFCDIARCREMPYHCDVMCFQRKIWERLKEYEDTGLEPEEIAEFMKRWELAVEIAGLCKQGGIDHIRELAKAEQDGRLVVLPCKVGDTVYEPNKRGFISIYKVISIHLSTCSILVGWELIDGIYSNVNGFEASALGKTVFLARKEAEAALAGKGGTHEDSGGL